MAGFRETLHDANDLFLNRWSPRSFDGKPLPGADLLTILDAGRWAPSAFNLQPWRFIYATPQDVEVWKSFLDTLVPFNRSWAQNAGALVAIVSETWIESPDKPCHTHSFDAGAAAMAIALQAQMLGYSAHAMAGFDASKVRAYLQVPEHFKPEVMIAIGSQASGERLPDNLKAREFPSDRKPLEMVSSPHKFVH